MNTESGSLPELSRLILQGSDRCRFLHNFCTNDVRSLLPGTACEAFFTDARSRILAHGWVAAGHDRHVIWMLGGDSHRLSEHLRRYILNQSVTIDRITTGLRAAKVPEQVSRLELSSAAYVPIPDHPETALHVLWRSTTIRFQPVTDPRVQTEDPVLAAEDDAELIPGEFRRLRILERFPLCGVDVTDEHLAAEAGRNAAAISFRKGCYLGQEPIARLDALGHLNRELKIVAVPNAGRCLAGTTVITATGASLGIMTSDAVDGARRIGLAILKLSGLTDTLAVRWPDGTHQPAEVLTSGT